VTDGPAAGVLVVGYGNPLRSDDGSACRGGRRSRPIHGSRRRDPGRAPAHPGAGARCQPGVAAGARGCRRGPRARGDRGPADRDRVGGPWFTQEAGPPLTHHMDPSGILSLSRELFGAAPSSVVLIGIGASVLEVGETLSPLVAATVPRVVELVAGWWWITWLASSSSRPAPRRAERCTRWAWSRSSSTRPLGARRRSAGLPRRRAPRDDDPRGRPPPGVGEC